MVIRYFETRRQFPRLKTDIKAIAVSQTGVEFPAVIRDISPDGAQFAYQGKATALLYKKTANYDELKKLKVTLKFNLPYADHESIEIHTKLNHHHHLGNYMYIVGVIFDDNDTEQKNKILDYLIYETEPTLEEIKHIYAQRKRDLVTHESSKKEAKFKNIKTSNIDINAEKPDVEFDLKHELKMISTTLNLLTNSIRLIEDKLESIERKIFK